MPPSRKNNGSLDRFQNKHLWLLGLSWQHKVPWSIASPPWYGMLVACRIRPHFVRLPQQIMERGNVRRSSRTTTNININALFKRVTPYGLITTWIAACPSDRLMSNFTCLRQLHACPSFLFNMT